MSTFLWVLQWILGAFFLMAGMMKLTQSREKLLANPRMGWAEDYQANQIQGIGAAEVLGGLGLVLPGLFDVATILTPIAAIGLAVVMIGAFMTHRRRGETQSLPINAVLGVLALVIAVGRFAEPL